MKRCYRTLKVKQHDHPYQWDGAPPSHCVDGVRRRRGPTRSQATFPSPSKTSHCQYTTDTAIKHGLDSQTFKGVGSLSFVCIYPLVSGINPHPFNSIFSYYKPRFDHNLSVSSTVLPRENAPNKTLSRNENVKLMLSWVKPETQAYKHYRNWRLS